MTYVIINGITYVDVNCDLEFSKPALVRVEKGKK